VMVLRMGTGIATMTAFDVRLVLNEPGRRRTEP
jgi:hypothetical protein